MVFRSSRQGFARPFSILSGAVLLAALSGATPARALDDGADNIFNSITSLLTLGIGVGGQEAKPRIDYRERAPLVLPPDLSRLPEPAPAGSARNAAWPQDHDLARARREQERARRPRDEEPTHAQLRAQRGAGEAPRAQECRQDVLERLCNPEEFWSTMRAGRSTPAPERVAAGQEPPRRALTDPPAGFRRASQDVRYTFEVERKVDLGDARAQALEDQRRARAISQGLDPNR